MIHVQHLLGIGHLMRARLIAGALADAGFDTHLVTGGRPTGGRLPHGVRTIQLPPIHASDGTFKPLRDADGQPVDDAYRRRRRDLLLEAYESAAPDVVIFETFPFGRRALHFEIVPLLERIASTRRRPLVIASVRDILQKRDNVEREREMLLSARRWFDAVLVHGDRRFSRLDETFPLASELGIPVHYTGFVVANAESPSIPDARGRNEVVVSAGGGTVGVNLLTTALAAQKRSRFGHLRWRTLAGPNIPNDVFERLRDAAGPGTIVERAREDFAALLGQALISVSQAGYNTVLDVVRSGARPVVVPFAEEGETEQRMRANRLRELELAVVVDDGADSPVALADAIDTAGSREKWGRWDFDCDGAARSAALVASMIETGAGQLAGRAT
jgi:predicted glycosyltransferase